MLLDDISDYLTTQGITTDGTQIYKSYRPDAPDAVIALYETAGLEPVRAMRSATGQPVEERPGLQVVVRAGFYDYQTARQKANDIWGLLENLDTTINSVRYFWIAAQQMPFLFGRDEQSRPLIACNYMVSKARST